MEFPVCSSTAARLAAITSMPWEIPSSTRPDSSLTHPSSAIPAKAVPGAAFPDFFFFQIAFQQQDFRHFLYNLSVAADLFFVSRDAHDPYDLAFKLQRQVNPGPGS